MLIAEGEDEALEDVNVRWESDGNHRGGGETEEGFAAANKFPIGWAVAIRSEKALKVTRDDGGKGYQGGEEKGQDDLWTLMRELWFG